MYCTSPQPQFTVENSTIFEDGLIVSFPWKPFSFRCNYQDVTLVSFVSYSHFCHNNLNTSLHRICSHACSFSELSEGRNSFWPISRSMPPSSATGSAAGSKCSRSQCEAGNVSVVGAQCSAWHLGNLKGLSWIKWEEVLPSWADVILTFFLFFFFWHTASIGVCQPLLSLAGYNTCLPIVSL